MHGFTVRDYIRKGLKDVAQKNGKLTSKFWASFHQEFPSFSLGCMAYVPNPPDIPLEVRDSLQLGVKLALSSNPALRSVENFELALEGVTDTINETELFGIIQASEEGSHCTRNNSIRMQLAILHLFARNLLLEVFHLTFLYLMLRVDFSLRIILFRNKRYRRQRLKIDTVHFW